VVDEGLPCFGAVAVTTLTDSAGSRPRGQFGEPDGGQRRELGGLEHTVSRRPAPADLPGVEQQREVPGDDGADDAERLPAV